ncbi:DUF1993 domain-containing protein [Ramlibacter humi]|uniref:DUF1993 domain-containing protein n=1 Tax=Ramlibacter humi TaxID=2530451 RepID=A0A4Z0CCZ6_9BURK|nr:DUF1993 domain-containing protein [Ramlibacter humi]TFZ08300.1 DUF1993 domain-containing protein [Ramlibacter humi]
MSISMSSASLPIFRTGLQNLSHILAKGLASAQARKFDPQVLVTARLAPDMLPLSRQVQIACDSAKLCVARISGVDAPKFEDNEASFDDLTARVAKTLEWLESVPAAKLDGTEEKEVTIPTGRETTRTMKAEAYLKHHALPNFFFHMTTAYAILRHNGVELGKLDYLVGAR